MAIMSPGPNRPGPVGAAPRSVPGSQVVGDFATWSWGLDFEMLWMTIWRAFDFDTTFNLPQELVQQKETA